MSYRDVVVTLTIVACLPSALLRPFFGLLLFSWLAYMRPQDLCWGFAKQIRFSLLVAVFMYVGWFFLETRKFTRWSTPMRWLAAFTLFLTISLLVNERLDANRPISKWFDLMKVFVVAFFTCGMVDDRKRLRMILWTITLSLGFYGVKFGLHGILRGGRILQGPGGMMLDNNDLCLAMAMNLPLLFFMGRTVEVRWRRRLCWVALVLTCVTVVCTLSRGGFLTMCLAGGLILNNLRKRILPWIVAGGLIGLALIALPEDAKKRLATLENPEQESSAASRLYAWQVGLQMVKANPFFGVGFEAFLSNFKKYDTNPISATDAGGKVIVAHNTYVQVWAELGTLAAFSFLAMLLSAILCLRKTRKLIARARAGPEFDEMKHYADMIQISLTCFMFGANFLNRAHFDLMYHLIALSTVVLAITRHDLAARRAEEAAPDEPEAGARAVLSRLPAYAGWR
jgi:probable O-glycosylation ligase (exosortase A-associated)